MLHGIPSHPCAECGEDILKPPRGPWPVYCKRCQRRRKSAARLVKKGRASKVRQCVICGVVGLPRGHHKYCSESCRKVGELRISQRWRTAPRGRAHLNSEKLKWQRQNPTRSKDIQRKYRYGIEPGTFAEMFAAQWGVCKICGRPETRVLRGKVATLCVDHDHTTGEVRGLLCHACNQGVARFDDDPDRMETAAAYVRNANEKAASGGGF